MERLRLTKKDDRIHVLEIRSPSKPLKDKPHFSRLNALAPDYGTYLTPGTSYIDYVVKEGQ